MAYAKNQWFRLTPEMVGLGSFGESNAKARAKAGDLAFVSDVFEKNGRYNHGRYNLVSYPSGVIGNWSEADLAKADPMFAEDVRLPHARDLQMWNAVLDLYYGLGTKEMDLDKPDQAVPAPKDISFTMGTDPFPVPVQVTMGTMPMEFMVKITGDQMRQVIRSVVTDNHIRLVVATFKDIDVMSETHLIKARSIDKLAEAVGITDRFIPEPSVSAYMVKSDVNLLAKFVSRRLAP